jgi:hypothetical protein
MSIERALLTIAAGLISFVGCVAGFVYAMAVLYPWREAAGWIPLSEANFRYALLRGLVWGGLGAFGFLLFTPRMPTRHLRNFAILGPIGWVLVTSVVFFFLTISD